MLLLHLTFLLEGAGGKDPQLEVHNISILPLTILLSETSHYIITDLKGGYEAKKNERPLLKEQYYSTGFLGKIFISRFPRKILISAQSPQDL